MPTERVVEIPWALSQLPHTGTILDIGSCDATYLNTIPQPGRILHCLDPRDCREYITPWMTFHNQSIIGNSLPPASFDAVLLLSVIEHIGLPAYRLKPFPNGDRLALAEVWRLLKPGCPVVVTVPAGQGKIVSWYRQYSPAMLRQLFSGWRVEIAYWGYDDHSFRPIAEEEVERYDYRDSPYNPLSGAGAVAGIVAYRS